MFGFITVGRERDESGIKEKAIAYPELLSFITIESLLPEFFHFHFIFFFLNSNYPSGHLPPPVCAVSTLFPFLCCHFAFLSSFLSTPLTSFPLCPCFFFPFSRCALTSFPSSFSSPLHSSFFCSLHISPHLLVTLLSVISSTFTTPPSLLLYLLHSAV